MISFRCDYEEGACPEVLERLVRTNLERTPGYGEDEYSRRAAEKIRTLSASICRRYSVFPPFPSQSAWIPISRR